MVNLEEKRRAIIAVDFDGTLCKDNYPGIGEPRKEIIDFIKFQKDTGAALILWTCRVGDQLQEAIKWCRHHGIEFDEINKNMPDHIAKYENDTRKVYADIYLDDRCLSLDDIVQQKSG